MGPLFGAKQAIFKAFSHNCTAETGVGVDHRHTTNDFCIAPRLAESGAHSMDSLMKKPSAQVCESSIMPLTNGPPFYFKAFSHNCTARRGVLDGAQGVKTNEKWAQLTRMCIPNWYRIIFGPIFGPKMAKFHGFFGL